MRYYIFTKHTISTKYTKSTRLYILSASLTGSAVDDKLYKKALNLEYFTVGYNVLEGFFSIFFGAHSGSIALIGFGLDSIVESLSGLILIWRLSKHEVCSEDEERTSENKAIKFVAATFFLLGAYVLYESAKKLIFIEIPEPSLPVNHYSQPFSGYHAYTFV